jgi:hypothetical protein
LTQAEVNADGVVCYASTFAAESRSIIEFATPKQKSCLATKPDSLNKFIVQIVLFAINQPISLPHLRSRSS